MKLLTKSIRDKLIANGRAQEPVRGTADEMDFKPVVKLFVPWGAGTWLLTELDPDAPDIAFGLCDLGMNCPELGSVSIAELEAIRGPGGLRIERDLYFRPHQTLMGYAREAWSLGRINA